MATIGAEAFNLVRTVLPGALALDELEGDRADVLALVRVAFNNKRAL